MLSSTTLVRNFTSLDEKWRKKKRLNRVDRVVEEGTSVCKTPFVKFLVHLPFLK
jgi:hypothetical protein